MIQQFLCLILTLTNHVKLYNMIDSHSIYLMENTFVNCDFWYALTLHAESYVLYILRSGHEPQFLALTVLHFYLTIPKISIRNSLKTAQKNSSSSFLLSCLLPHKKRKIYKLYYPNSFFHNQYVGYKISLLITPTTLRNLTT